MLLLDNGLNGRRGQRVLKSVYNIKNAIATILLRTKMAEIFTDQYAQTNYSIKEDVKNFWYFLKQVQEIRRGVQAGRHQSAE